jgi:hypothetical protein
MFYRLLCYRNYALIFTNTPAGNSFPLSWYSGRGSA